MKVSNYLLCTLFLLPATGSAQITLNVKPGLWEHSLDLKSESGRIEATLETMRAQMMLLPPEQRQMLENMMQRQGVKFDLVNQSFQNCVSEEEAATGQFNFATDGGCEFTDVQEDGADTRISFVCAQGQGDLVLTDGAAYQGASSMTLDFNGVFENATATHSGRWLGASCAALGR